MKRLALATTLAVVFGSLWITSVAFARPVATSTYADTVQGIEISPGIIVGNVRYGAAFVGKAIGDLPGAISVSIRYTPPNPGAGVTNIILGGLWSLKVYENGNYKGSLYGQVRSGEAAWNDDGTRATLSADLSINGGTGAYKGRTGSGSFSGMLYHDIRIGPAPTWGGALTLATD